MGLPKSEKFLFILIGFFVLAYSLCAQTVYRAVNANSDLVLEVGGYSTSNGGVVQQWQWAAPADPNRSSGSNTNQQWTIIPAANGYSKFVNVNSGKVLEVSAFSQSDGARIQQWDWLNGVNQQWMIIPQSSSLSEIVNLNSGKVLDVTGFSTSNGKPIQQWDWSQGLNQQWQIEPVQTTRWYTSATNIFYHPNGNFPEVMASVDQDYNSAYYYSEQLDTSVKINGQLAGSREWGGPPNHQSPPGSFNTGYGTVDINASTTGPGIAPLPPGAYVEASSDARYYQQYTYGQITASCGADCSSFYDPYAFALPGSTGEGSDLPSWSVDVWATPVITIYKTIFQLIGTAHNGASFTAPGNRSIFDLKVRQFTPPAWVNGAPGDVCFPSTGGSRSVLYGGDNRGFDPFSTSYRGSSEALVSSITNSLVGSPAFDAGVTHRYASDALPVDGYTLATDNVLHDCHYLDDAERGDIRNMHVTAGPGGGGSSSVSANFYGSTTNLTSLAGPLTPSIDWNVTFTINITANPLLPAYTYEYTHDCFPAHEAYIGSQRVYGYKPGSYHWAYLAGCLSGAIPQIVGSTIGTVQ